MRRILFAGALGLLCVGAAPSPDRLAAVGFSVSRAAAEGIESNGGRPDNQGRRAAPQRQDTRNERQERRAEQQRRNARAAAAERRGRRAETARQNTRNERQERGATIQRQNTRNERQERRATPQRQNTRNERQERGAAPQRQDTRNERQERRAEQQRRAARTTTTRTTAAGRAERQRAERQRADRAKIERRAARQRVERRRAAARRYGGAGGAYHNSRPHGWRPARWRGRGWRPHHAYRAPYWRSPHPRWGRYHYSPFWDWYFVAPLATATLVYVATLPADRPCESYYYEGERLYACDGVLYRPTEYQREVVYEIVSDEEDLAAPPARPLPAAPRELRLTSPMMTGAPVRALQQELAGLGYLGIGEVDGVFGPRTDGALRAFQREWGVPATGALDEETAALLGL